MSETTTVQTFEVNRSNWQQTRTVDETFDGVLQDNEVLLAIDRFALTANNITYCVSGDMLGYWRFFPAQEGWGRIPAMGFADVAVSNCPGIAVGERVWGFLPMATHLKIQAGNKSFVEGLGCYDRVITYDEIGALDAAIPSIVVDMAGSDKTLADIHHHFADQLRFSSKVGATHYEEMTGGLDGSGEALPGAEPVFFFAPAQIEKRNADWGAGEVMKRLSQSLVKFLGFGAQILTVKRQHGAQAMADSYLQMLAGTADASVGYVMSLRD